MKTKKKESSEPKYKERDKVWYYERGRVYKGLVFHVWENRHVTTNEVLYDISILAPNMFMMDMPESSLYKTKKEALKENIKETKAKIARLRDEAKELEELIKEKD